MRPIGGYQQYGAIISSISENNGRNKLLECEKVFKAIKTGAQVKSSEDRCFRRCENGKSYFWDIFDEKNDVY